MWKSLWIVLTLLIPAWAVAAETVLVTLVQEGVTLTAAGGVPARLEAFIKLNEGDRLTLPKNAQFSMVFIGKARQETWRGPGVVQVGGAEGKAISGKPELTVKGIPEQVARQMNRMPTVATDGRVGMLRLRSIPSEEAVARLESDYQALRKASAPSDRNPEILLLGGLFELREYDRVRSELTRLTSLYPADPGVADLVQLYTRALEAESPPLR